MDAERTITVIQMLLQLLDEGRFSCTKKGAKDMTTVCTAAELEVARLQAELKKEEEDE